MILDDQFTILSQATPELDHPLFEKLCLACRIGDLERVRQLVELEEVGINRRDMFDSTPLYYSCLCGHKEVVKYLLTRGAECDPNKFEGSRCFYGALTDEIRGLLHQHKYTKALDPTADYSIFMASLLENTSTSDVQFIFPKYATGATGYQPPSVHVHRSILAARSSFFAQTLSTRWRNIHSIPVKNVKCHPVVFVAICHWFYTGLPSKEFPLLMLPDLLFTAKQWKLKELVAILAPFADQYAAQQSSAKTLKLDHGGSIATVKADLLGLVKDIVSDVGDKWCRSHSLIDALSRMDINCDDDIAHSWERLSATHPDIIVRVSSKYFPCHRAFLYRCEYFRALLNQAWSPAPQSCSSSNDIPQMEITVVTDEDVFAAILQFLYTDTCDASLISDQVAVELLEAADELLLPRMQTLIVNNLVATPGAMAANHYSLIRLAWRMNLPRLEQAAVKLFAETFDHHIGLEEFKDLIQESWDSIVNREELDTLIFIDDLRWWLGKVHGFENDMDVGIKKQEGTPCLVGERFLERRADYERKNAELDELLAKLHIQI